ncbi:MAG: DUF4957 domain-containing protein [Bacteroidales bacterium]|nr:DUF4957 domain-containing protein [Bacteroidales bacterium]
MKKILLFATALAALFLSASCQRENLEPVAAGATFTVTVPGETATKAFSDGTNINKVLYEIYKTDEVETATAQPLAKGVVSMSNKEATVTFDLLQDQEYTVIFWAQKSANEDGTNKYYNTGNLRTVSINAATALNANDEDRAAFFKRVDFATPMAEVKEVELVRPFAQLNLGTTAASLNPVQPGQTQGYTINVEKSYVKVEGLSTTFNTLTGVAAEEDNDFEFALYETPYAQDNTEVLEVNGVKYHYVGMNYFFVSKNEDLVTVSYKIKTDKGEITNDNIINVPVKANYRTNIIGNLLTTEADFEIVVDENFNIPDLMQAEGWVHTGNYTYKVTANAPQASLKEILAHADASAKEAATKAAGPEVVINLEGDVYWETGAEIGSTPLLPDDSPISSVVINGNGKTFTATGKGVGKIRLANGSVLTFNDLKIVDKSVSYAEDSWEYGYLEFGGAVSLNDCEVVNAIMLSGETATLTGCSFNSNHDNEYAVWVDNGSASFTGCTFTGARGLKTHEAYGSEVVEITVDGCTFGPLTMKPGMAIGTVNDKTSITIKNSFFIGCQAGDQGLYIYETDTDVTTFTFVEGYNEVHANSSAMLKDWVEKAQAGDVVEVPAGEYTFPAGSIKEGMTLKCAEGTVFEGSSNLNINGATVVGATFSNPNGNAAGSTINGTFKDCEFTGKNAFRYCYAGENAVFENCTFKELGDEWLFHFDGGDGNITCINCTFDGKRVAIGGSVNNLVMENCKFINGSYFNTYCNSTITDCALDTRVTPLGGVVTYNNCTKGGEALTIDKVKFYNGYDCTINIDDVTYTWKNKALSSETGEYYASTASMLKAALDAETSNINLMPGEYEIDFYSINHRDELNIKGSNGAKVAFNNLQVRAEQFNTLTIENCEIMRMPNKSWGHLVFGASKNANGVYTISNCTFNGVGTQGIYINETVSGATYNINNCTFNGDFGGEGAVTIQNNDGVNHTVNVTGCTFNDIPATSHEVYVLYAFKEWTLNVEGVDAYWKALQ